MGYINTPINRNTKDSSSKTWSGEKALTHSQTETPIKDNLSEMKDQGREDTSLKTATRNKTCTSKANTKMI